ncbi:MAG: hypothetical protein ABH803_00870 [Candidatus Micrarchaeota archaeon]
MQEFVLFQANNSGFEYNLSASDEKQVISLLADVRNYFLSSMPIYCPVSADASKIVPKVKGVKEIVSFLSSVKPSELEREMAPFVLLKWGGIEVTPKHASPMDFGWVVLMNSLWKQVVPLKFSSKGSCKQKELRLAANYQGWVVVKKVNLEIASRQEVLAFLVGAFNTVDKKLAEYSFSSYFDFEAFWQSFSSNYSPRKSFVKLSEMLRKAIDLEEDVRKLSKPGLSDYCVQHFYHKIFEFCGYSPFATVEMINNNYPALKIPKPKGNFGKKKKK